VRFQFTPISDVRFQFTPISDVRFRFAPITDVRFQFTPISDVRFRFGRITDVRLGCAPRRLPSGAGKGVLRTLTSVRGQNGNLTCPTPVCEVSRYRC
jgi:hypothetical protein